MQHDLIRQLRRVRAIPLTPVITHTISEYIPLSRKVRGRYRPSDFWIPFQSVLSILVPEVECPVGTSSAEGAMLRMEGYGVDGENVGIVAVANARLLGPMAFEREVRRAVFVFDILNGASALHAADGETTAIIEAGHHPSLPFQGRLDGFVEIGRVVKVDNVDVAIGGGDDEESVHHVQTVDTFLTAD